MSSNSKRIIKFEELAEKRVNDVIKKIRLIGNLSNKSNYDYSEEHVRQIFSELRRELKDAEMRFSNTHSNEINGFKFKK